MNNFFQLIMKRFLLNVLGTMFWILYWQMYWGFGIGSLDAFAFFSSPFTSFHFLSFPDYCFLKNFGHERS